MHVFEVTMPHSEEHTQAQYKLNSTVMLTLQRHDEAHADRVDVGGNLSREVSATLPVTAAAQHVKNLGCMIEDIENKMRNELQEIYFGKMQDVSTRLRSMEDLEATRRLQQVQSELVAGWQR